MDVLVDFVMMVKNIVVAFLTSWLRFFVSPPRKCVKGEVVLVTGAGLGMGRQMALEFAELGAVLVLWDISVGDMAETERLIKERGGTCHTYVCDVSNHVHVQAVAERVRREVGDVTILINNAGIVVGKRLLDLTDEEVERTLSVNLLGMFWTTKQFLPSMLENNHGHIVNMSSSCGIIGLCRLVDYSTSKFGVMGFTQTLNYEIHFSGYDGVHTTLVSPTFTTTGMFNGCKMAFPRILPELHLHPTVQRIMQAILTNQQEVCIPRTLNIFAALKHILPVSAMCEIIQFFQADRFMDSFSGRKNNRRNSNGSGISPLEE